MNCLNFDSVDLQVLSAQLKIDFIPRSKYVWFVLAPQTNVRIYDNFTLKSVVYLDLWTSAPTAMPTKSDIDLIFCLQLLSKTLTCTLILR